MHECCPCLPTLACEVNDLKAEIERLRSLLDEAQLRSIEARNPGIDMDEVRASRSARIDGDPHV